MKLKTVLIDNQPVDVSIENSRVVLTFTSHPFKQNMRLELVPAEVPGIVAVLSQLGPILTDLIAAEQRNRDQVAALNS